jgi:hypothetical protein
MLRAEAMRALVTMTVVLISANSQAAEHSSDVREEVRRLIQRATEAFERKELEKSAELSLEARALLRQAGLSDRPELAYNAGLAYELAGAWERTAELFEEFLHAYPAAADDAGFRARLEEARARAPMLRVDSEPSSASLSLDGRPAGITPFEHRLRMGRHDLRLELADHLPIEATIEVERAKPLLLRYKLLRPPPPVPIATEHALEADPGPSSRVWLYAAIGAGVAAAATSVALHFAAKSARDDAALLATYAERTEAHDRFVTLRTTEYATRAGGLALLGAAAVLYLVE